MARSLSVQLHMITVKLDNQCCDILLDSIGVSCIKVFIVKSQVLPSALAALGQVLGVGCYACAKSGTHSFKSCHVLCASYLAWILTNIVLDVIPLVSLLIKVCHQFDQQKARHELILRLVAIMRSKLKNERVKFFLP